MKLVRAILIILTFAFSVNGQTPASPCEPPKKSDWDRDEFRGQVKTVRVYETFFVTSKKTGRLEKKPRELVNEAQYDAQGDRAVAVEVVQIRADVEVASVKYVCGNNGKVQERRFVTKDGTAVFRTTYNYDEQSRLTAEIDHPTNDSTQVRALYIYDAAGNVIEEVNTVHVEPEHFLDRRTDVYITTKRTYKYDARKNMIEERGFYPDGSLGTTWLFNYDARDRVIKKTRLDKLGRLENQYFYEYYPDGRLLTETDFHNFCVTLQGDFCKGNISSGDGFFYYATKTNYHYDSRGNWVKQVHSDMRGTAKKPAWKLSRIVEREITYYSN